MYMARKCNSEVSFIYSLSTQLITIDTANSLNPFIRTIKMDPSEFGVINLDC
jgi:hypothetical protein